MLIRGIGSSELEQGRAALVLVMARYSVLGYRLVLLEIQKFAYFLQQAAEKSKHFLRAYPETHQRFERVERLIRGFETPYGMELLASVHWVARNDLVARDNADATIERVHAWSKRKRELFEPDHIAVAWERLREHGWL